MIQNTKKIILLEKKRCYKFTTNDIEIYSDDSDDSDDSNEKLR